MHCAEVNTIPISPLLFTNPSPPAYVCSTRHHSQNDKREEERGKNPFNKPKSPVGHARTPPCSHHPPPPSPHTPFLPAPSPLLHLLLHPTASFLCPSRIDFGDLSRGVRSRGLRPNVFVPVVLDVRAGAADSCCGSRPLCRLDRLAEGCCCLSAEP